MVSSARLTALSSRSRRALVFIWACTLKFDICLVCCVFPTRRAATPSAFSFSSRKWIPVVARFPVVLLLTRPPALSAIEGTLLLVVLFDMLEILLPAVDELVVEFMEPKSHGCLGLLLAVNMSSAPAVRFSAVDGSFMPAGAMDFDIRSVSSNFSKLWSAFSVLQNDRKSSRTRLVRWRSTDSYD
jgi:hypothetical protein